MIKGFYSTAALASAFAALTAAVFASIPVQDWKLAGPFGGTATSIALDPENPTTLLAGGMDSLLFQSRDAGENWDLVNFPRRDMSEASAILVDPDDSKHYLVGTIAATGGGLFESRDAGATWTANQGVRDFGVRALAAAPSCPTRFVAGTTHGVLLSDDSGKTWTRISDTQNAEMQAVTAVAVDSKDANVIYAGTSHLPWKTTDGGKTWESIHTGMIDDSDVFSIYVDPVSPSSVLASACSGIYLSDNRGDAWRKLMGIPNTSRRTHVVRENPDNSSEIFAGTTTGLFKSPNKGVTWKTLTNTQVNAMVFDAAHPGSLYLALEYDGLSRSRNAGDEIDPINHGFIDRFVTSVSVFGDKLVAVETQLGETSGIFVSADQGESWGQIRSPKGLGGVHLRTITGMPSQDRLLLAASPNKVYKSTDAGLTWKAVPIRLVIPPPPAKPEEAKQGSRSATRGKQTAARPRAARAVKPKLIIKEITPSEITSLASVKNGTKELIYAATDLGLLRSEDAGEHWTLSVVPGSVAVSALYMSPASDGYLVAKGSGGLSASPDYGEHWAQILFPLPASDVNEVAIPVEKSSPLLIATRLGLYSSPDFGNTWYAITKGLPPSTVSSVVYSPQKGAAYALQYGQLFVSTDEGSSWSAIPATHRSLSLKQLWVPDATSARLYGITTDLGILFRN